MRLKITVAAVGKLGRGPEADLVGRYKERLAWPLSIREIPEARDGRPDHRKRLEAEKLSDAVRSCDRVIALDERGAALSTRDLFKQIEQWSSGGILSLGVVIGGPDGLDKDFAQRQALRLCFGQMTWPHKLVRAMLLEQLYRIGTIAADHPYHRD